MTTDIQITTIEGLLLATKGSPMERILHYLIYQDFPELPKETHENEGGKVISSFTLSEKAIFATRVELVNQVNELIKAHKKIATELNDENIELGKEKISKLSTEIEGLSKLCEDLNSMLWIGTEHRLASEGIFHNGYLVSTSDYSIISLPKDENENDFFSGMANPLGMFLNGIMGESKHEHEHDCDNCPVYDKCTLPIKKPR